MNDMPPELLAKYLARKIFEVGSYDGSYVVTRIQFMIGKNPERAGGGFGQQPLADFIARCLTELYSAPNTSEKHDV
jgi:hypothetical protein